MAATHRLHSQRRPFQAVKAGTASVVTDEIERFTEGGIALKSGATLDADVVVTATGFNLNVLGDIALSSTASRWIFPRP